MPHSLTNTTTLKTLALQLVILLTLLTATNTVDAAVSYKGRSYVAIRSVKSAYHFTNFKKSGGTLTLTKPGVNLKLTVGSRTCVMNTVKFILSYPVLHSKSNILIAEMDVQKVIDPVLRPTFISNAKSFRTVVIDPGHGGKDAGAVNRYGTEAGYNLKVARIVKKLLTAKGYKVIMTRDSDYFLTLQQRVNLANRYSNAIFISIHFNAASRSSARGIETFTLSPKGTAHYGRSIKRSDYTTRRGNHHDSANIALATAIHGRVLVRTRSAHVPDRGIKRARFSVLSSIKHPAILIEGGFMSNPTEAKLLHSYVYQNTVATAIAEGINRYRRALNAR